MPNMRSPLKADNSLDVVTCWRLKLNEAQENYQTACECYRRMLEEDPRVPGTETAEMARARATETQALKEYRRTLSIFADLTLYGKLPAEPADTGTLISVVDNDISIRDALEGCLRSAGYRAKSFDSARAFLESDVLPRTDCLILDVHMPGMDGLELQERLRTAGLRFPIIFISAQENPRHRQRAAQGGAFDFFLKPFSSNHFIASVRAALESSAHSDAGRENVRLENDCSLA
jgi:CheY-like chemotaxis protein